MAHKVPRWNTTAHNVPGRRQWRHISNIIDLRHTNLKHKFINYFQQFDYLMHCRQEMDKKITSTLSFHYIELIKYILSFNYVFPWNKQVLIKYMRKKGLVSASAKEGNCAYLGANCPLPSWLNSSNLLLQKWKIKWLGESKIIQKQQLLIYFSDVSAGPEQRRVSPTTCHYFLWSITLLLMFGAMQKLPISDATSTFFLLKALFGLFFFFLSRSWLIRKAEQCLFP